MDKPQYKLLLSIKRSQKYDHTIANESEKKIIYYLANLGYISFGSDLDDGKSEYCQIEEPGNAALYEWRKERRRWFIPMSVSLFAAIGGYREELSLALQALQQLLRSIKAG